jgi:hypothetical protein
MLGHWPAMLELVGFRVAALGAAFRTRKALVDENLLLCAARVHRHPLCG